MGVPSIYGGSNKTSWDKLEHDKTDFSKMISLTDNVGSIHGKTILCKYSFAVFF